MNNIWLNKSGLGVVTSIVIGLAAGVLWTGSAQTSPPAPPDSIVQITAEAQGLQLMSPSTMPDLTEGGTFWVMQPDGNSAPWPCQPQDTSLPIYQISERQFLVDSTGGMVSTNTETPTTFESALLAQADSVIKLVTWLQGVEEAQSMNLLAQVMGMNLPDFGDEGGGGGGTNSVSPMSSFVLDTNALYLTISNVVDGVANFHLHNATNQVYAILGTNILTGGGQVVAELWPTGDQTNVMPFSLPTLDQARFFVRAEDWTGVDSNSDGVPDWWLWKYFGTLDLNATNLDSAGNTLGDDFTNGVDPNVILFTVTATNQFVNQSSVPVQIQLMGGMPSYYAVLATDPNPATNWLIYPGTNITVNLGSTDGVYTVSVGLRGLPESAQQTWQTVELTRDTVPPTLVVTNPIVNITAQPMIQLQGFTTKALADVSYDISNAVGVVNNLKGAVKLEYYDPVLHAITTNWIQCYDIDLTNGLNSISLRVTDLAGNITTTNLDISLDYGMATNPLLQVIWPPDGAQICDTSFTCRGILDDPTASITAQILDTNGHVTMVRGQVERYGNFWLEYLPLSSGTNFLTIAVTNAAGLASGTNLIVVKNELNLTMNPIPPELLWQPTVNVTGTVSDVSCNIWINEMPGVNNGDGTWYALNVPTTIGGMASFVMRVEQSGGTALNNLNLEKPAQIVVSIYLNDWKKEYTPGSTNGTSPHPNVVINPGPSLEHYNLLWLEDFGTVAFDTVTDTNGSCTKNYYWPADQDILDVRGPSVRGIMTSSCSTNVEEVAEPIIPLEQCYIRTNGLSMFGTVRYERSAQTILTLLTGGKGLPHHKNLFQISGDAFAITNLNTGEGCTVPSDLIQMGQLGKLGTDFKLWCALQDNGAWNVTPVVLGNPNPDYYTFNASQQKYKLTVTANTIDLSTNTPEFCVGQLVNLLAAWNPALPSGTQTSYSWILTPEFLNAWLNPATSDGSSYPSIGPLTENPLATWWYSSGYKPNWCLTTNVFSNGQQIDIIEHGDINIYRPQVHFTPGSDAFPMIYNGSLELGDETLAVGNMTFAARIATKAEFPGAANWTQLNKREVTGISLAETTDGQFWLDNSEFYNTISNLVNGLPDHTPINPIGTIRFSDSPGVSDIGGWLTITDSFQTYLMFKPDPQASSIWVALGLVTWDWSATETAWTMTATNVTQASYIDTDAFPQWLHTGHNSGEH